MRLHYILLHGHGMGGTVRTVFNQANAMAAAGHDVEIVSVLKTRKTPYFPLDPRVRIVTLVDETESETSSGRGPVARYATWQRRRLSGRPPQVVPKGEFAFRFLTRYVEKTVIDYIRQVPDGVLVTTRPALNLLAARYASPDVVRIAQEHMNFETHKKSVRKEIRLWYPRFDAIAVLTPDDRERYTKVLPDTKLVTIPNAVHSLDQEECDQASKVMVAVGRLFRQKGFDLLIQAFEEVVERYPDWQLRVYGSGQKKDELRKMIDERHLYNNMFLMGRTQHMDEEMRKASFFVMSSRFEGLPMVIIEAMTHALPIVSFDCPTGPAEVLTDGVDGVLVPPGDVHALADAMIRMIEDPEMRAKMGAAAKRKSVTYGPDAINPRWERLFTELTTEKDATIQRRQGAPT